MQVSSLDHVDSVLSLCVEAQTPHTIPRDATPRKWRDFERVPRIVSPTTGTIVQQLAIGN